MPPENTLTRKLVVAGAPHIHGPGSVSKIMWGVVIALLPALAVSVYYFGLPAVRTVIVSTGRAWPANGSSNVSCSKSLVH